jgi:hypothetical protein
MLKIKDSVSIEELIKLGYEVTETLEGKPAELEKGYCTIELYDSIYDKWNTRILYVTGSAYLDEVYDLIKADIVEKI